MGLMIGGTTPRKNQDVSNLVIKETGKSLVADTEIAKIHEKNADAETASSIATIISGVSADTIADADTVSWYQAIGGALKKITWANIIATIRTAILGSTSGILKANGSGVVSAASVGTDYQAPLTFGIADTNALRVDDADATAGQYARFTANGMEGVDAPTAGGCTEVTYEQLVAKIGASELVCGSYYLITDFATVHWMVDVTLGEEGLVYSYILDGVGEKIIHTGENEPIVVLATSINTLAPEAYSTLHPTDALKYDWNPLNYSTIKQFYDSDLSTSPAGFKGIITRREDVTRAIKTNYDFREITYRLWDISQTAWDSGTTYTAGEFAQNGTIIYYATDISTDVEPGVDEGWESYWTLILNLSSFDNAYLSYLSNGLYSSIIETNIPIVDTDVFIDRTMFLDGTYRNIVFDECNYIPYVTYGSDCNNITYGSGCNFMTYGSDCNKMTYGSGCNFMTYGSNCNNITYGSGCNFMTYGSYCDNITYGSDCNNMTYWSYCNTMTYGSYCNSMTYRIYCNTMTYGSYCNNITYGSYCNDMTYGSNCGNMTFPDMTAFNDFKDGVGNIDFTGVGIIQITNGTTITHQLSGLEVYQSYIDASSTPIIVITTNTIGVYSTLG